MIYLIIHYNLYIINICFILDISVHITGMKMILTLNH